MAGRLVVGARQAWALYGFGTAYALSGDTRFLDTAERCADFFLDRTGDRLVPPNDWEDPIRRGPTSHRPPRSRRVAFGSWLA